MLTVGFDHFLGPELSVVQLGNECIGSFDDHRGRCLASRCLFAKAAGKTFGHELAHPEETCRYPSDAERPRPLRSQRVTAFADVNTRKPRRRAASLAVNSVMREVNP